MDGGEEEVVVVEEAGELWAMKCGTFLICLFEELQDRVLMS